MNTIPRTHTIRFAGKGQVTIPRRLRKELDIKGGTRVLIYQEGDAIVLKPITPKHVRNLRGSLKGSGVLKSLMNERKRERKLQ